MVLPERSMERTSWFTWTLNARASPHFFRRHDQELGAVLNLAGDVIGQAAIGKRDVRAALEDGDLGRFIDATRPGSGRSAACHAADNNDPACRFSCLTPEYSSDRNVSRPRFQGILASSSAIPQVPVMPAKRSPQPMMSGRTANHGSRRAPESRRLLKARRRRSEPAA